MSAGPAAGHPLFRLDEAAVACPYPLYETMRRDDPVSWVPEIEAFAVTRYADVQHVLRDPLTFSSAEATGPIQMRQTRDAVLALADRGEAAAAVLRRADRGRTPVLLRADPPLHGRQRSLVARAFTPRRAKEAEPIIRQVAADLLDAVDDPFDLVAAYAVPLPLTVIADRLGVPRSGMATFKRWSDDFVVAIGNHDLQPDQLLAMLRSQAEFFESFTALVEEAAARPPTGDILSDVVHARTDDGEALSLPEMLGMFSQFLVAGNETTAKLLTSAVRLLLADHDLEAAVRADLTLIEPLVEEVLRLEAPVQGLFRTATVDAVVGGTEVPAGSALWLVYASANRDGDVFTGPDELRLDRDNGRQHLSFGLGEHYCVGAALARTEAQVGVEVLLERFPTLTVVDRPVEYEPSYVLHGLRALWLAT